MTSDKPPAESSICEIFRGNRAVGLGFAIAPDRVVTCAHVVNAALGRPDIRDPLQPGERERVLVRFGIADGVRRDRFTDASVCGWLPDPGRPFDSDDVAILGLAEPAPASVRPLRLVPPRPVMPVQLWGPQPARETGGHVRGELMGQVPGGRVQISVGGHGPFRVRPGFSGGPVWEPETGDAVGVLAACGLEDDATDAYLLRTGQIRAAEDAWQSVPAPVPSARADQSRYRGQRRAAPGRSGPGRPVSGRAASGRTASGGPASGRPVFGGPASGRSAHSRRVRLALLSAGLAVVVGAISAAVLLPGSGHGQQAPSAAPSPTVTVRPKTSPAKPKPKPSASHTHSAAAESAAPPAPASQAPAPAPASDPVPHVTVSSDPNAGPDDPNEIGSSEVDAYLDHCDAWLDRDSSGDLTGVLYPVFETCSAELIRTGGPSVVFPASGNGESTSPVPAAGHPVKICAWLTSDKAGTMECSGSYS